MPGSKEHGLPSVPKGLERELAMFLSQMRYLVLRNASAVRNASKLSVKTKDIRDRSITSNKLYDHCVTREKIADGAITKEKLAEGVLSGSKTENNSATDDGLAGEAKKEDGKSIEYSMLSDACIEEIKRHVLESASK